MPTMSSDPTSPAAVVLLSGGLDSATVCAIAAENGHRLFALSFDYGQRHRHELTAAEKLATRFGACEHRIARIDLRAIGGSALTGPMDVPKDRTAEQMSGSIPITYVPARNTIFLSHALAWAEVLEARDIYIGVNAVDYSGYPDCRPQFITAFETMANLATRAGVESSRPLQIHTPLIDWPKTRIIEEGLRRGIDFAMTHSCYDPDSTGTPCARCDACRIRIDAFEALGMTDPALRGAGKEG